VDWPGKPLSKTFPRRRAYEVREGSMFRGHHLSQRQLSGSVRERWLEIRMTNRPTDQFDKLTQGI